MLEVRERRSEPLDAILRVENLGKHFQVRTGWFHRSSLHAVDGVGFSLRRGETLAIVGESGSGKSTLARALLRLIEPTTGAVYYGNRNLLALSADEMRKARRGLQMIFQDPYASLHPRRTVAEIISDPWKVHSGIVAPAHYDREVAQLLGHVGLSPSYAHAYPATLSGGERQRVAIARAIALRPAVLILDEPVSALDVSIQAQVIKLLMQLQQELGMAYIFISHDLPLMRLVADRVAVMYMGRFVEEDSAQDIYANPAHPYTQLLLSTSQDEVEPTDASARQPGSGAPSVLGGCRFRTRCPKAQSICVESEPELTPGISGEHSTACHFAAAAALRSAPNAPRTGPP